MGSPFNIDPELADELRKSDPAVVYAFLISQFRWTPPSRPKLDFSTMTEGEVRHFTRFTPGELKQVAKLLGIPTTFHTRSRFLFHAEEALFLFLCRLAAPLRLETMQFMCGYSPAAISEASSYIVNFIYVHWDHLLLDFRSPSAPDLFSHDRLKDLSLAVFRKGSPLPNVWGFIDCTIRKISLPIIWQQECYNGYKHLHALKYSAVKGPDGIIYHLEGPLVGRRNDNSLLNDSLLEERKKKTLPRIRYIWGPGLLLQRCHPLSN